ncbi:MAG: hypothetical protein PHT95_06135 [Candidatus Omnitrophica bacterium]|nr:hypothetical protein [Candidatus Omnitrophota bacterium]
MFIRLILAVTLILSFAPRALADDKPAENTSEWLQYKSSDEKDYELSAGIRYERKPDGTVDIDVASMASGKGADFRRWEVVDIKLDVGGSAVRPKTHKKIYGRQESFFRAPAALVFAAIGAAYGIYGKECSSSGSTCAVSSGDHRGAAAKTIDTAGMAIGLGLLASQAKGEITGQKASFTLTNGDAEELKGIKLTVEHKTTNKKTKITIPVENIPGDILTGYAKAHQGIDHKAEAKSGSEGERGSLS